jgi:hypothetical protein
MSLARDVKDYRQFLQVMNCWLDLGPYLSSQFDSMWYGSVVRMAQLSMAARSTGFNSCSAIHLHKVDIFINGTSKIYG